VHELVKPIRHRDLLPGRNWTTLQGPAELEREEWIALRELVKPSEHRARERVSEAAMENPVQGAKAEWAEPHDLDTRAGGSAVEVERQRLVARRPPREQPRDTMLSNPSCCERESRSGGDIEPLDVVDGDEQGICCGQYAENGDDCKCDCAAIERAGRVVGLHTPERDCECAGLRGRQGLKNVVGTREEIRERRERDLGIRLGRTRLKNASSRLLSLVDEDVEQQRLPDPDLAFDHESTLLPAQKVAQDVALSLAPDYDLARLEHHSIVPRVRGKRKGSAYADPHEVAGRYLDEIP
jgi:hypothetical protein